MRLLVLSTLCAIGACATDVAAVGSWDHSSEFEKFSGYMEFQPDQRTCVEKVLVAGLANDDLRTLLENANRRLMENDKRFPDFEWGGDRNKIFFLDETLTALVGYKLAETGTSDIWDLQPVAQSVVAAKDSLIENCESVFEADLRELLKTERIDDEFGSTSDELTSFDLAGIVSH